jgi:hypothetical protein
VLIVSIAWGTALFYLAARLGVDSHLRLSLVDGAHVYVGLVGGVFILGKVARVRFRYRVSGVPEVVPWQRWVSWSLLILYSAIFVSGVLALLPLHGQLYEDILNFHLLSSVWAVVPTTWHVWHYRRRAAPFLTRLLPRGRTLRYWAGLALAVLPAVAVISYPRSLSQLPQVLGGSVWSQTALSGSYLDRITMGPGGSLLAAGDALYISRDGTVWTQIDMPAAAAPASGGTPSPVHQHGAPTGKNLALSLAVSGNSIYVGANGGLYRADTLTGMLADLGFPGKNVSAIIIDPTDSRSIWAAASSGLMHSSDAGATWTAFSSGLIKPDAVSALAWIRGRLYASDTTGIYVLDPIPNSWNRISTQPSVVDLTPSPDATQIYATSTSQGVEVLAGGSWRSTASLLSPHQAHLGGESHPQVLSVAPIDGRLYAVGTAFGVSASADEGQTWSQLGLGLGDVTPAQVIDYQNTLLAATSNGIFRFPLIGSSPASAAWWAAVIGVVVLCGAAGVLIVGLDRLPRTRSRPIQTKVKR